MNAKNHRPRDEKENFGSSLEGLKTWGVYELGITARAMKGRVPEKNLRGTAQNRKSGRVE